MVDRIDTLSKNFQVQGKLQDMAERLSIKHRGELEAMLGADLKDFDSLKWVADKYLGKSGSSDKAIEQIKIEFLNKKIQDLLKNANEEQKSFVSKHFGDANNKDDFKVYALSILSQVNGDLGMVVEAVEKRFEPGE
ncbi:MAG: hypothetical protein KDJ35_03430 [Alphaproteobacteria bacterium]|nr:hypothetical protein [Alphaproteobacteria bacterium]